MPDRETVRPNLERTDSPALLPSGFRFSPEQPGFGAFPSGSPPERERHRGGRPPSGLLSLAEPAYAPRPSPAATTVLMTGFRQRFVRPLRRLSRLVAGTAGGPCVGDPVSSRSLPVYLIQLSFSASRPKVARAPGAAMFRFSCADPMAVGSALVVYITTYVAGIKWLVVRDLHGWTG